MTTGKISFDHVAIELWFELGKFWCRVTDTESGKFTEDSSHPRGGLPDEGGAAMRRAARRFAKSYGVNVTEADLV